MSLHDRVLWEEGMFLGPQHFQQWDRHNHRVLQARAAALQFHGWGFTHLALDPDALLGGEVAVKRVAGIFKDGTVADAPELDPLPAPRPVKDAMQPRQTSLRVFLAVADARIGSMVERAEAGAPPARYRRELLPVLEEAGGALERDLAVGRLALRILLEGEAQDGCQVLPMASVVRGAGGNLEYDSRYIPPVLHVAAAPALADLLRRTVELLSAKSQELARKRGQRIGGSAQFSAAEAAGFWLLHTVNSWLPLVVHDHQQPRCHPETVYRDLAGLVGALCTFGREQSPRGLPAYDHAGLTATFAELERHVRELAVHVAPENCVPIPLQPRENDEFLGRVEDEALFDRAEFYLAVRANVGSDKVIREIPFKAKISSAQRLVELRTYNYSGIKMVHAPSPPADIPQRAGFHYFQLRREGQHWDAVKETRTLALFVPAEFAELELELVAVRGGEAT